MSTVSTPPASSSPDEIIRYRHQVELTQPQKLDGLREAIIDAASGEFRACGMIMQAEQAEAMGRMAFDQLVDLAAIGGGR